MNGISQILFQDNICLVGIGGLKHGQSGDD